MNSIAMNFIKKVKFNGFLHLTTNQLYEQEALDGLRQQLEAEHGVKIIKHFSENYFFFLCENYGQPNCCRYCVKFEIKFRANRSTKRIFSLVDFILDHNPTCKDQQSSVFMKKKHILNNHYGTIMKLVRQKSQRGSPFKSPTDVMERLCQQENLGKNFLFEGLVSAECKRKIKKKFDNIVAEARRICKEQGFSSDQKVKNDGDKLFTIPDSPPEVISGEIGQITYQHHEQPFSGFPVPPAQARSKRSRRFGNKDKQ